MHLSNSRRVKYPVLGRNIVHQGDKWSERSRNRRGSALRPIVACQGETLGMVGIATDPSNSNGTCV